MTLWAVLCLCSFWFSHCGCSSAVWHRVQWAGSFGIHGCETGWSIIISIFRGRIKASKSDPFRKGVSVYLGFTDADLCPVVTVLNCMVQRGSSPGLSLHFQMVVPWSGNVFRQWYVLPSRWLVSHRCIMQDNVFGNGATTTATFGGVQGSLIKTPGRWERAAYSLYIPTPQETFCAFSRSFVSRTAWYVAGGWLLPVGFIYLSILSVFY